MIAFEHGALQHHGEPLFEGILAHGVLAVSDAQVITFAQLTAASYAIERGDELGAGDVRQLYAPFEPFIEVASLA